MLPALREELALYPGPADLYGAPTWSVLDPARNLFFRIDWPTFEILSRWHLGDGMRILDSIRRDTTLAPDENELGSVLAFLAENELLRLPTAEGTAWYADTARSRRVSPARWLLHHYLFVRIPLWRPDAWLARWLPRIQWLYGRTFVLATLAALATGLLLVSRRWDEFVSTLVDAVSWEGLAASFLTLAGVKVLHELGHAFTAKRLGCRVPTIGLALLVLFPVAYTDVNEAWKLPSRRARLAVGAAGIATELAIAAWATLAWALLPAGQLRSAAFVLATTTWISTLLVNASPFMRFDGYFLMMDWLDLPNLHERAFALGRQRLRRALFGLADPPPEVLPPRRAAGLVAFAYATWMYRLSVFAGIAALVYTWLPKPFGPGLAAIEVGWFIALPVVRELAIWRRRGAEILRRPRTRVTLALLATAGLVLFVPWDPRVRAPALLHPARHALVAAPAVARIAGRPFADGAAVAAGAVLVEMEPPDLGYERAAVESRAANLAWRAGSAGFDDRLRSELPVVEAAQGKARAELAGLAQDAARFRPTAPFAGRFYLRNPDLGPGAWVAPHEPIGTLADPAHWRVEAYLGEADVARVAVGDRGRFYAEASGAATLALTVVGVDRDATRVLAEGLLASSRGGPLATREGRHREIVPDGAVYRVSLDVTERYAPTHAQALRGRVVLLGRPEAWGARLAEYVSAVVVRESGF